MKIIRFKNVLWGVAMNDTNYGTISMLPATEQRNGDVTYVPQRPLGFLKSRDTVIFDSDVEVAPEIVEAILGK